jgi:hypothetical protein
MQPLPEAGRLSVFHGEELADEPELGLKEQFIISL